MKNNISGTRAPLIICCVLSLIIIMASGIPELRAEYIFTTDGAIHKGKITTENSTSITISTDDNKTETYKRAEVMRILYTELNMGKILVQKKDGESFTAYMVDEDRDSYTFRNDLYKPEEFKQNRKEVLFIAERAPSGLKGKAGTGSIELTWYPPYDEMKSYNIYIKKNKKDKYELAATTGSTKYTLKNLPSNTKYFITVTAVDPKGDETPGSNELEIVTKNIIPLTPERVWYTISSSGDRVITWEPSVDPDGVVEKYRIYILLDNNKKLLAEPKKETFTVSAGTQYDRLYVCAVDDRGDESDPARVRELHGEEINMAFYPGIVFPLGDFGAITGMGFGGTFSFVMQNYLLNGYTIAVEAGFYTLMGKDALETETKKTEKVFMAPLMLTAGYNFQLTEKFTVIPYIGLGVMYFYSEYVSRDLIMMEDIDDTLSELGPLASAGVSLNYIISDSYTIVLRGSLNYMTGTDAGLYAGCDMGIMYRL